MADESLTAYLREVQSDPVAVPSMAEWLRRARTLGPVDASGPTGPELVAAGRTEDDERVAR